MKILDWFPKPRALTELTLLSKIELILYLGFFLLFSFLYWSFSRIPVKDINIEVDRIDYFADNRYNESDSMSIVANSSYIRLYFPLSDNHQKNISNVSTMCISDDRILKQKNYTSLDSAYESYCSNKYSKHHEDSLLEIYKSLLQIKDTSFLIYQPLFYQKVYTSFSGIRFISSHNKNPEFYKSYHSDSSSYRFVRKYGTSNMKKTTSTAEIFGDHYQVLYKSAVFNTPSLLDFYDISQCYYRIKIRTQLVNHIELNLLFSGANEFTFIEIPPDSIYGQSLFYTFQNERIINGISKDIELHVKTQDLEGKQSARMFFVTAVLSALVTIFLAFFIVYGYRKSKSIFCSKNKKEMDKIIAHSKSKHRYYKSRK